MGFKRPEVQILSPRPRESPWKQRFQGLSATLTSRVTVLVENFNAEPENARGRPGNRRIEPVSGIGTSNYAACIAPAAFFAVHFAHKPGMQLHIERTAAVKTGDSGFPWTSRKRPLMPRRIWLN
jgi:hypothetical protein